MQNKKVYIASDHAGFELKEALTAFLTERGFSVEDLGPFTYDKDDDYPDTIAPLARAIADDKAAFGIAIGMSGQGEAMACNRYKGARAAVYYGGNKDILKLSREHNNANVLSLGAKFLSQEEAKEAALEWLNTGFSGEERHARRIAKLDL
ncbi:MAG: RpiB/LacA/LacB family sugar-phosphate isomerase [Patescibacteria group bacterium]|nr:RpiB/LacA/LacB family sugar-phosphate isomerase [Patescibacteria group bacterium]